MRRHLLVILSALLLSCLLYSGSSIVMQPPLALAHAFVIGSDPVDGSTINTVPSVVRIFFNATISPISVAHVYSIQDGKLVNVGAARSSLAPTNPRELDIPVQTPDSQPQGSYEVIWTAVANDDGHTTYGIIGFNVGFSSTGLSGVATLGPSTSNNLDGVGGVRTLDFLGVLSVAWEWLILLALTFWIGILVMERLLLKGAGRASALLDRARKQALPLQWLCLCALLFGEAVTLVLRTSRLSQVLNVGGFDFTALYVLVTDTNYGCLLLIRAVLILIALGLLYWTNRPQSEPITPEPAQRTTRSGPLRSPNTGESNTGAAMSLTKEPLKLEDITPTASPTQRYTPVWLLLAGLILLTYALSGDATQVLQPHISAVVLDWLHLIAQGIWFGGFTYLGYVLLSLLPAGELDRYAEPLALLLQRLVPFLLGSIGVLLTSDLFLGEASIGNPQQFLIEPYGRTLFVQIIIVAVMLLFSLYTLLVLCPRFTRQALLLPVVDAELPARRTRQSAVEHTVRALKRLANVQAVLGAGVLLCAALMFFFAPPIVFPNITYSNPPAAVPTNNAVNVQTKQIGDLSVTLQVLPGRVGYANTVVVTMTDSNGMPVTDAQVRLITNMQIMDMGTQVATVKGGNPTYVATFEKGQAFSMAGVWVINVRIQRPGHAPVQGSFQVSLSL